MPPTLVAWQTGPMRWQTLLLWCVVLTLCVALIAQNFTSWKLVEQAPAVDLGHGARLIVKQVKGPVNVKLTLVFFDQDHCNMRVISQQDRRTAQKATEMLGGGIAICNGGYFKNAAVGFLPSAMEIADGVRAGEFADMAPTTGALVVTPAGPSLITAQEFKKVAGISQMLECGPIMVTDGVPLPPESKELRAHRTFIATDGGKRWCIGVCDPIGNRELAALLMTPGLMNECPVHRALNLDGGPSTSLAWRGKDGAISHAQQPGIVRNYVQVVPVKTASQP